MPATYPPLRLVPRSPDLPPPTPAAELAQAMLRRSLHRATDAAANAQRTRRELVAQERELCRRILAARSPSERVRLARMRDEVRATLVEVTGPEGGAA